MQSPQNDYTNQNQGIPNPYAPSSPDQNNPQNPGGQPEYPQSGYIGQGPQQYGQGMNVNVTPENPIAQPPSGELGSGELKKEKRKSNKKKLIPIIIVIAVIAVAGAMFISKPHVTTTISTTSIPTHPVSSFTSCTSIRSPGFYYQEAPISTKITNGTCISVTSSNVKLICNGNKLVGSAPLIGKPPFSVGINASGVSNVTVENCAISNFSYGVYAYSSSKINVSESNVSFNVMSDIYLNDTNGSTISSNKLYNATSAQGALFIGKGSTNTTVIKNAIGHSAVAGVNVFSQGNKFYYNNINLTPTSFACSSYAGFPKASSAIDNVCYNNTGCDFITCSGINLPDNLSSIVLSPAVTTCGSIDSPGTYTLQNNLTMYLKGSSSGINIFSYAVPCIKINSALAVLNCNNHTITNATIGIMANGKTLFKIENCRVSDTTFGALIENATNSSIYNSSFSKSYTGITLSNSNLITVSGADAKNDTNGIYLSNSSSAIIKNFNFSRNSYGIYVNSSIGNSFTGGVAVNNSQIDLYATPNSANSTDNFMGSTVCGLSDTHWSTCRNYEEPYLKVYPVFSCGSLYRSGNYSLSGSLAAGAGDCLTINANNVKLSCNGNRISEVLPSTTNYGIFDSGYSNITITNCTLSSFKYGLYAANARNIRVSGLNASLGGTGITLSNVSDSSILKSRAESNSNYDVVLNKSSGIVFIGNNMTNSRPTSVSMLIENSTRNTIANNTGLAAHIGMQLSGASQGNNISNNYMELSGYEDYVCAPQDSSLNSENGGINYGTKKSGCHWLAALSPTAPSADCQVALTPTTYSLSTDALYESGNICYGIYSPGVTLNCNNHTIISNSGGTFAAFAHSGSSEIENCYLKGFTSPITATNTSISIINETVYVNSTKLPPSSSAILVNKSKQFSILRSDVLTDYIAINISNSTAGSIKYNNATGAISYYAYNTSSTDFQGNIAPPQSTLGLYLYGSTADSFQDNTFNSTGIGIECLSSAQGNKSAYDQGGNVCSSSENCGWISASSLTCK